MSALDSLKVTSAPAALADTARAHNALADLIASMIGQNGVNVTVSEGRILIEGDPSTARDSSSSGSGTATVLHYNAGGVTIDIDGGAPTAALDINDTGHSRMKYDADTGKLSFTGPSGISVDIDHNSTSATMVVNGGGGRKITLACGPTGTPSLLVETSSYSATLSAQNVAITTSSYSSVLGDQILVMTKISSGKTLTADSSLLTHDINIREIDVCDSGVAKKMLVLGSAPY